MNTLSDVINTVYYIRFCDHLERNRQVIAHDICSIGVVDTYPTRTNVVS